MDLEVIPQDNPSIHTDKFDCGKDAAEGVNKGVNNSFQIDKHRY
jgi:hypothetical protein